MAVAVALLMVESVAKGPDEQVKEGGLNNDIVLTLANSDIVQQPVPIGTLGKLGVGDVRVHHSEHIFTVQGGRAFNGQRGRRADLYVDVRVRSIYAVDRGETTHAL